MKSISRRFIWFSMFLFAGLSNLFALSANARIIFDGNFVSESKLKDQDAEYNFFNLDSKAQKDADGIVFEFSDGNFGGRLGLWYTINGKTADSGSAVSIRRTNLWIKPLENIKVTAGYVGNDQLFKEKIDNWKVGNPFNLNERDWSSHPGYINCADVDEMGFGIDYKPFDGLALSAGIARRWGNPGNYGKSFISFDSDNNSYDAWGISARYYLRNFCLQAAVRDNGKESWKVLRCAAGYEANGLFAFIQPCFGIDYDTTKENYELSGICFDAYGEYRINAWTFILHAPVTIRLTEEDEDPSYMEYVAMAKYNMGKFFNMEDLSPYLKIGSLNHDGDNSYAFYRFNKEFKDSVNFDIKAGASFAVSNVSFNTGFEVLVNSELNKNANNLSSYSWKIPFETEIKF